METKICKKCEKELPVEKFYKSQSYKDGYNRYCKDCYTETRWGRSHTGRTREDPRAKFKATEFTDGTKLCLTCDKIKPIDSFGKCNGNLISQCKDCRREYVIKKKFGISQKEYNKLLKEQNNVCVLCGRSEELDRNFAIDHCHNSGKIRGLLCFKCNTGLGSFGDSIELLLKAVEYLKKHQVKKNYQVFELEDL